MTDTPDADLLEQYARENSGAAFTALVERHVGLVHSVALRHTASPQHAQDITQAVFIILARKAAALNRKTVLPGWLYHTARLTAANFQRAETSRIRREQEAFMQSIIQETAPDALWAELSPLLDEAMSRLGTTDRDALVLRYFQNKSLSEVGAAMGLEERTAQKRVARAIEKLRKFFAQRGVTLTATAIAGAVSANSVHAAPAGLASTLAATAYAAGANSFSLSTLIQTLLMKKTTYAVLAAALIAAISIPIIVAHADGPSDAPVTEANLHSGLVLHYTFDNAPVAGKVADVSGNSNDGSVNGAQWKQDPQRGGVIQFSPPGQYIRVPNNDSLSPSNITLAAWIKTSNKGETWRRIFDKSWTNGFALSIVGGHKPGFTGDAEMEIEKTHVAHSNHSVADGKWHHVAVTYNGAEEIFYADGVPQTRTSWWQGRVPSNSHDLTIGINLVDPNPAYNEVGASFDGLIDEPMIYNRALSPDEIKFLFESQRK
jgi:RNA polymerase sigma factor (sigma-70 family)